MAIAIHDSYITEAENGRIQINANLYDAEGSLLGAISLDFTVPGNTAQSWVEGLLVFSAVEALEFLPTSSIRVVTTIQAWGRASLSGLTYGLNPIEPKFRYEIVGDSVTVTGFPSIAAGVVTIPSEIDGLPVTKLDPGLLGNSNVTALVLPASLSIIGDLAFEGFPGLESIIVAPENTTFASLDGVLFDATMNTLIRAPRGKTGSFVIPEGITAIADRAFRRCGDLDSIMFPGTVSDIGNDTFDSCYNLTTVTLPDSVASIGAGAFSKCFNLEYVIIGDDFTIIGDRAFESCGGLTNLTIPNSVTWIGDSVFATCTSLTSVSIGSGVNDIGDFAFAHCGEAAQAETGRD